MPDGLQLRFRLGGDWYGLPLQEVLQVAPLQGVRAVPRAPDFIRGLMELHGRLLTVLDLPRILGRKAPEPGGEENVLVLTPPYHHLALSLPGMPRVRNVPSGPGDGSAGRPGAGGEGGPEGGKAGALKVADLIRACEDLLDDFLRRTGHPPTMPGG